MNIRLQQCLLLLPALMLCACATSTVSESQSQTDIAFNLIKQKDYAAAKTHLDQALESDSHNAMAHLDLGVVYQNTGNPAGARTEYNLAITDDTATDKMVGATSDSSNGSVSQIATRNLERLN
ncbi:MAG: tetratricopeptide repeat protein [Nevskia sp.]|nr:tetratricopeptide repeat protein [Nevskia sp.]